MAERKAAHAVWADPYWAMLPTEDRVAARTQLQHLNDIDET